MVSHWPVLLRPPGISSSECVTTRKSNVRAATANKKTRRLQCMQETIHRIMRNSGFHPDALAVIQHLEVVHERGVNHNRSRLLLLVMKDDVGRAGRPIMA